MHTKHPCANGAGCLVCAGFLPHDCGGASPAACDQKSVRLELPISPLGHVCQQPLLRFLGGGGCHFQDCNFDLVFLELYCGREASEGLKSHPKGDDKHGGPMCYAVVHYDGLEVSAENGMEERGYLSVAGQHASAGAPRQQVCRVHLRLDGYTA